METILSPENTAEITKKGRYITSGFIGTKSAELYFFKDQYYVVWYKRSLNFVSIHKIEAVTGSTAKMLFEGSV